MRYKSIQKDDNTLSSISKETESSRTKYYEKASENSNKENLVKDVIKRQIAYINKNIEIFAGLNDELKPIYYATAMKKIHENLYNELFQLALKNAEAVKEYLEREKGIIELTHAMELNHLEKLNKFVDNEISISKYALKHLLKKLPKKYIQDKRDYNKTMQYKNTEAKFKREQDELRIKFEKERDFMQLEQAQQMKQFEKDMSQTVRK